MKILRDFICKNNRFAACLFKQTHAVTIFGEDGVR